MNSLPPLVRLGWYRVFCVHQHGCLDSVQGFSSSAVAVGVNGLTGRGEWYPIFLDQNFDLKIHSLPITLRLTLGVIRFFERFQIMSDAEISEIICCRCKVKKPAERFNKNKTTKTGYQAQCKECFKAYNATRKGDRRGRKMKEPEPGYLWCSTCSQHKTYDNFPRNRSNASGYARQCKQCYRNYYARNKTARIQYQNTLNRKYFSSLQSLLFIRLMNRWANVMQRKGIRSKTPFRDLLGCDNVTLLSHFQSLYKEGMTDFNYGTEWEIDHYYPICSFDLRDPEQLKKCFHYTNVHPLWIHENQAKGTMMPEEYFTDDQEAV